MMSEGGLAPGSRELWIAGALFGAGLASWSLYGDFLDIGGGWRNVMMLLLTSLFGIGVLYLGLRFMPGTSGEGDCVFLVGGLWSLQLPFYPYCGGYLFFLVESWVATLLVRRCISAPIWHALLLVVSFRIVVVGFAFFVRFLF